MGSEVNEDTHDSPTQNGGCLAPPQTVPLDVRTYEITYNYTIMPDDPSGEAP